MLLSEKLNDSFKEFQKNIIENRLEPDKMCCDIARLKSAVLMEMASKNPEFKTEIVALKIAMNELKKINKGDLE